MPELNISDNFTIEDIHKIREYNYEMTKHMTRDERAAYYRKGAEAVQKQIDEIRKAKGIKIRGN